MQIDEEASEITRLVPIEDPADADFARRNALGLVSLKEEHDSIILQSMELQVAAEIT